MIKEDEKDENEEPIQKEKNEELKTKSEKESSLFKNKKGDEGEEKEGNKKIKIIPNVKGNILYNNLIIKFFYSNRNENNK